MTHGELVDLKAVPQLRSVIRHDLMRRILKIVIVGLAMISISSSALAIEGWQFGVARIKITPEQPMWMAGYGARDHVAEGTLTDLWAKAMVLQDSEGKRIVLVTMDLVGIEREWAKTVTEQLAERYGLSREQVALNASHTHTGPVVGQNLRPMHYLLLPQEERERIDLYSRDLQGKIVEVVGKAIERLSPGRVSWGNGRCSLAVNRRENRPEDDVPQRRRDGTLLGPVDHDVPVLAVHDEHDQLRVVVFGYACHATVLSFYQWSGDYPGFAQLALEELHPNCTAMFWAGCGADQNPLPRRSVDLAKHYGDRLATAVDAVLLTSQLTNIEPHLSADFATLDLPLDTLPTEAALRSDAESSNRFVAARAQGLLEQIDQGKPLSETYPYPIQRWQLGDQVDWWLLGGEVVVDFAIRIKSEQKGTATWVAGYSNDVMAYIPSRRVWTEGGYEGADAMIYYGLPTRWAPTVEEDIIGAVRTLANEAAEAVDAQR